MRTDHLDLSLYRVEEPGRRQYRIYRIADNVEVCGARTQDGSPCLHTGPQLKQNGRCYQHGRYSGRVPISARWAQAMPRRLRDAYAAAYSDLDLLDVGKAVAALSSFAERAMQRAEEYDTPDFRRKALDLWHEARDGNEATMAELGALLERGCEEDRAMRLAADQIKAYCDESQREQDRRLRKECAVNARDLTAIMVSFRNLAVERFGVDEGTKLLDEIDQVMGRSLSTPMHSN